MNTEHGLLINRDMGINGVKSLIADKYSTCVFNLVLLFLVMVDDE